MYEPFVAFPDWQQDFELTLSFAHSFTFFRFKFGKKKTCKNVRFRQTLTHWEMPEMPTRRLCPGVRNFEQSSVDWKLKGPTVSKGMLRYLSLILACFRLTCLHSPSCHVHKLQCVIFTHNLSVTHHFNLRKYTQLVTLLCTYSWIVIHRTRGAFTWSAVLRSSLTFKNFLICAIVSLDEQRMYFRTSSLTGCSWTELSLKQNKLTLSFFYLIDKLILTILNFDWLTEWMSDWFFFMVVQEQWNVPLSSTVILLNELDDLYQIVSSGRFWRLGVNIKCTILATGVVSVANYVLLWKVV